MYRPIVFVIVSSCCDGSMKSASDASPMTRLFSAANAAGTIHTESIHAASIAANLLFIAANRFRRNSLKYQAGGAAIADQEKFAEYDAAGARLWADYKAWVTQHKRSMNAEMGYAIL